MSITTLALYEKIRSRISEEDADFYFETFETLEKALQEEINMKVDRKFENMATKTDIADLKTLIADAKSDLFKWYFGSYIALAGLILALSKHWI